MKPSELPPALAGAALALLAGCASDPVVPVPPPAAPPLQTVIIASPPQPQAAVIGTTPVPGGAMVVTQSPPAVQQQVVSARPSADHVWVEGWWVWRDGRYVWRAGEWVIPPRLGAVWNPPRWERRDNGWVFVDGFWN